MIIMLGILFFSGASSGYKVLFSYAMIACLERGLKLLMKRPRPFAVLPGVQLSQPCKPLDSSHPSGDTMRVWYLALVVPAVFSMPFFVLLFFSLVAIIVSLGRIAFGVHFPLDVLGGVGLGFFGAGLHQLLF
ncbi:MAG: phosphatase PAP2 family protein [Thermodesulfobacteriota bacterium]|nr:phosphatase PAP2 family protein [Thermodesulfobacteriota bacterium]